MPWGPHLIPRIFPPELVNEGVLKNFGLVSGRHPVKSKPHLEAIGDALCHKPLGGVVAYRVAMHPAPQIGRMTHVDSVYLAGELADSKLITRRTVIFDVLLVGPMFVLRLEQLPVCKSGHSVLPQINEGYLFLILLDGFAVQIQTPVRARWNPLNFLSESFDVDIGFNASHRRLLSPSSYSETRFQRGRS